jgi:hypothetical protein
LRRYGLAIVAVLMAGLSAGARQSTPDAQVARVMASPSFTAAMAYLSQTHDRVVADSLEH